MQSQKQLICCFRRGTSVLIVSSRFFAPSDSHPMKPLLAAFLSLLLFGSVQAQNTDTPYKKVAVTSLIGDVITVDIYRKRVGTMIDSNLQEKLPVPTAVFDELALKTASDAVTKALPSASTATLSVAAPGSDLDPAQFLVDGRIAASW